MTLYRDSAVTKLSSCTVIKLLCERYEQGYPGRLKNFLEGIVLIVIFFNDLKNIYTYHSLVYLLSVVILVVHCSRHISTFYGEKVNASVNSSGAHLLLPGGNRGAFAHVVSSGVGHSQVYRGPGGWALAYPGATPGHLTYVFLKDR